MSHNKALASSSSPARNFIYLPYKKPSMPPPRLPFPAKEPGNAIHFTQDYFPFGSLLPDRGYDAGEYRFGFNGKEQDKEFYGDANAYDFGARIYDPRVGRWMSVDPLANMYYEISPYVFCVNSPLINVDRDGQKIIIYYMEEVKNEDGSVTLIESSYIYGSGKPVPNNQFVQTCISAIDCLIQSGYDPMGITEILANDNNVIGLYEGKLCERLYSNLSGNTSAIPWNPKAGQKTKEGGRQSPLNGLFHELCEAYFEFYDPLGIFASRPEINDYKQDELCKGPPNSYRLKFGKKI